MPGGSQQAIEPVIAGPGWPSAPPARPVGPRDSRPDVHDQTWAQMSGRAGRR
jgi:hypothetical protein